MLTGEQVLNRYFPEVRARLIEIAAAMDRFDRAAKADPDKANSQDERLRLLRESLQVLAAPNDVADRAERIQMIFSDPYDGH